jgi:hypothetical protein
MTLSNDHKEIATMITKVIKIYSLNAEKDIDEKFKVQLAHSIYILTHIYVLLKSVVNHPKQDEVTNETFDSQILIWQACNSMIASIQLIRQGYPLEPQFLMRVAIESFALAISFHLDRDSYTKYKNEKLYGKDCIGTAKKALVEIGQIYGLLSAVTHPNRKTTGNSYNVKSGSMIIGGGYTEHLSHRVLFNFSLLNYLLLTLWKGAELIFFEFENNPKFWKTKEDGYILNLDASIKQLVKIISDDFKTALSTGNIDKNKTSTKI